MLPKMANETKVSTFAKFPMKESSGEFIDGGRENRLNGGNGRQDTIYRQHVAQHQNVNIFTPGNKHKIELEDYNRNRRLYSGQKQEKYSDPMQRYGSTDGVVGELKTPFPCLVNSVSSLKLFLIVLLCLNCSVTLASAQQNPTRSPNSEGESMIVVYKKNF